MAVFRVSKTQDYSTTQYGCLDIETNTALANFYIDDITVTELANGAVINTPSLSIGSSNITAAQSAGVCSATPYKTSSSLEVKRYDSPYAANNEKIYFSFENADLTNALSTTLTFKTSGANKINLYKLPTGKISSVTTYNSAPFNDIYGTGLNLTPYMTKEVTGSDGNVSFEIPIADANGVFALCAETPLPKVYADYDFEDDDISFKKTSDWYVNGYTASSSIVTTQNTTQGGSKSLMFPNITYANARFKFNGMLKNSPFTTDDIGRKFNVKMRIRLGDQGYASSSAPSTLTTITACNKFIVGMYGNITGSYTASPRLKIKEYQLPVNTWSTVDENVVVTNDLVDGSAHILTILQSWYQKSNTMYVDDIKITELFGDSEEVSVSDLSLKVKAPAVQTFNSSVELKDVVNYKKDAKNHLVLGVNAKYLGSDVSEVTFYNNGEKMHAYLNEAGSANYIEYENAKPGNYSVYAVVKFEDGTQEQTDTITFRVVGDRVVASDAIVTGSVAAKSVSVEWTVENQAATDESVLFVIAAYDNSDNLVKCSVETLKNNVSSQKAILLTSGQSAVVKQTLDELGNNVSYVKAFIWKGEDFVVPVTSSMLAQ